MQDHGSFRGVVDLSRGRDRIRAGGLRERAGRRRVDPRHRPARPEHRLLVGLLRHAERSDLEQAARQPAAVEGPPARRGTRTSRGCAGEWLAPTIISPHSNQILYHGMQYLMMSRDRGDTWEIDQPGPHLQHRGGDGRHPVPHDLHDLRVAAARGPHLRRHRRWQGARDAGTAGRPGPRSWPGLPYQKWVSRIVASAFNIGTVYMTQNGKRDDDFTPYVWKSDRLRQDVDEHRGEHPDRAGQRDPGGPGRTRTSCTSGPTSGVYVTTDGGKTWNTIGTNLPAAYVHDLVDPPARQRDGHRDARPRDVGARRRADQQEVDPAAALVRELGRSEGARALPAGYGNSGKPDPGSRRAAGRRRGPPGSRGSERLVGPVENCTGFRGIRRKAPIAV